VKTNFRFPQAAIAAISLLLVSCGAKPTATNSQASVGSPATIDYSPRIGIAVRTDARACVAIKNAAVPLNSPITLVVPAAPQSFVDAQISGPSPSPCPMTQDAAPDMTSFEISLPKSLPIPKLMPLIAVVGTAASSGFTLQNAGVQADLGQNQSKDTFRACGANDGIHLTVWSGIPVTGTRLWSGYYYEAGNPGTLPTCGATELVTSPSK
jgi:hypothetical protein